MIGWWRRLWHRHAWELIIAERHCYLHCVTCDAQTKGWTV